MGVEGFGSCIAREIWSRGKGALKKNRGVKVYSTSIMMRDVNSLLNPFDPPFMNHNSFMDFLSLFVLMPFLKGSIPVYRRRGGWCTIIDSDERIRAMNNARARGFLWFRQQYR